MQRTHTYTWEAALAASEKVTWRVEDLIGGEKRLDFTRPFLPESLAGVEDLAFLVDDEKRTLNQIRGHGYLCMFGLVEEFILPFVLDHARPHLDGDDYRTRALLTFAEEEAKHIHLFKRFRAAFDEGFGSPCAVIGPPEAIAKAVLAHDPLAVALVTLHIEWMTQRHFQESVRGNDEIDPLFQSLLRHHWMEEAQHAKLDTLMVESLAEGRTEAEIRQAVDEYFEIGAMLDEGLAAQVELDLEAFTRATGRELDEDERWRFLEVQQQAQRWTFIGSAMTHPEVLATFEMLSYESRRRLEEASGIR